MGMGSSGIEVFSTCPQSKDFEARNVEPGEYLRRVADVARWSDEAGYRGILVYTDNSLVDPWLVAQLIVQNTTALAPLVAVQPVYMHPYTAAKMIASIGHLHGRQLYLNIVAGGFKNDLAALNDPTPHDERYDRAVEYTLIIKGLLAGNGPLSLEGRYYRVTNLKMSPPLPSDLVPGILISGSSDAGLAAARAIEAIAVRYPKPADEEDAATALEDVGVGCRVGIIARETADEAWRVALARFPEDRKGQIAHKLAMKVSDSHWHRQLSERSGEAEPERSTYWLGPFHNFKTFCPYLVGTYATVGEELAAYIGRGFRAFILDIPAAEEDIHHTALAFREAEARVTL